MRYLCWRRSKPEKNTVSGNFDQFVTDFDRYCYGFRSIPVFGFYGFRHYHTWCIRGNHRIRIYNTCIRAICSRIYPNTGFSFSHGGRKQSTSEQTVYECTRRPVCSLVEVVCALVDCFLHYTQYFEQDKARIRD